MKGKIILSLFIILMCIGTASAIDVAKQWYPENQTMRIYNSLNGVTWATVQLVSINPDIDRMTKEYNVTAYVNYTISDMDSFKHAFKIEKGKNGITGQKWYILKPVPYVVNDHGVKSTWKSKVVYNNETGLNETIWYWDNRTVVIGNHTEYHNEYRQFNPQNGISVLKGKSYHLKQVLFKKAELGDVRINTNVTFFGLTENNMTWWNGSWTKKTPVLINNTGGSELTDHQVNLNISYDLNMNTDFSDIRVINDTSGAAIPYWIENKVDSTYANIWFNATNIPAAAWTNTTYYLYYGNPSASSASNGTNTFEFFDDFSSDTSSSYTISGGTQTWNAAGYMRLAADNGQELFWYPTASVNIKDLYLNARVRPILGGSVPWLGILIRFTNTSNYWNSGINLLTSDTKPVLYKAVSGSGTRLAYANDDIVNDIWYDVYFYTLDNDKRTKWLTTELSTTDTALSQAGNICGYAYSLATIDFDMWRVRKYASPEPTAQLGIEESPPRVQIIIID